MEPGKRREKVEIESHQRGQRLAETRTEESGGLYSPWGHKRVRHDSPAKQQPPGKCSCEIIKKLTPKWLLIHLLCGDPFPTLLLTEGDVKL